MFKHEGKTVNVLGKNRVKTYRELYEYIEELENSKQIKKHDNYLGDNILAQNIRPDCNGARQKTLPMLYYAFVRNRDNSAISSSGFSSGIK